MTQEGDRTEKLLEQILYVLSASAVQGKSLSEGAPYLDRLGVDRGIIAAIYSTSDGSVRSVLSQAKKLKRKGAAK